ncbi:MAG: MerR family transcriptional regulator [Terracoccus sp.]
MKHWSVKEHTVGDVAARLGVAPSTVRMWGSRYGLTASSRSTGGHRRFTDDDLDLLERFHQAVIAGESPRQAAADLTGGDLPQSSSGGPGGSVLAVPGAGRRARGLARAASRLDEMAVEDGVLSALEAMKGVAVWDEVVRPLLVAAGEQWQHTGTGIEVEHLLTQAVSTALIRYTADLPELPRDKPVLLAGGPHEEHVLPLHAVRACLAERGIPSRLLGPRTPISALSTVAQRTRAPGVLIWMSLKDPAVERELGDLVASHRTLRLFLAGPGWVDAESAHGARADSLSHAVDQLAAAWASRS